MIEYRNDLLHVQPESSATVHPHGLVCQACPSFRVRRLHLLEEEVPFEARPLFVVQPQFIQFRLEGGGTFVDGTKSAARKKARPGLEKLKAGTDLVKKFSGPCFATGPKATSGSAARASTSVRPGGVWDSPG